MKTLEQTATALAPVPAAAEPLPKLLLGVAAILVLLGLVSTRAPFIPVTDQWSGEPTAFAIQPVSPETLARVPAGFGQAQTQAHALVPFLMTTMNRNYQEMHGGWGPHLRRLMRDSQDQLWFAVDAGASVQENTSIHYFQSARGGPWTWVTSQPQLPGIQQNAAHVMSQDLIFSYGINPSGRQIQECYFSARDTGYKACNTVLIGARALRLAPNSNYVGAAVSPRGARVVWWTTVGANGGGGTFSYIANYGSGWNGPFTQHLSGYNYFGYARAAFVNDTTLWLVGQSAAGQYGANHRYQALFTRINLRKTENSIALFSSLWSREPARETILGGEDIWVDPRAKNIHILARTLSGNTAYYFVPAGSRPRALIANAMLAGESYSQFAFDSDTRRLAIIGYHPASGSIRTRQTAHYDRGIALDALAPTSHSLSYLPLSGVTAIFTEAPSHQSRPPRGLHFAISGSYPDEDHLLWHLRARAN